MHMCMYTMYIYLYIVLFMCLFCVWAGELMFLSVSVACMRMHVHLFSNCQIIIPFYVTPNIQMKIITMS